MGERRPSDPRCEVVDHRQVDVVPVECDREVRQQRQQRLSAVVDGRPELDCDVDVAVRVDAVGHLRPEQDRQSHRVVRDGGANSLHVDRWIRAVRGVRFRTVAHHGSTLAHDPQTCCGHRDDMSSRQTPVAPEDSSGHPQRVTFFPLPHPDTNVPFGIAASTAFVFTVILAALVLFATEPVPVDVTAIGVLVALLLVEPVTATAADWGLLAEGWVVLSDADAGVSFTDAGLSGFASSATLTVLAMFILSDGVQRTGIVQILGDKVSALTGDSETRQLGATIGLVSPISGFINNTAAVAILLPMVTDVAHEGKTSPSKLLMPLSYASMFGGMLTLIGTSTNILASELSGRLGVGTFSMFEFTQLGIIVSLVGTAYLLTVGRWLTPERIPIARDLTEEFEMGEYLTEVVVPEGSAFVGVTIEDCLRELDVDADIVQLVRDDAAFSEPLGQKVVRPGDVFVLRTDRESLVTIIEYEGLDLAPDARKGEAAPPPVTPETAAAEDAEIEALVEEALEVEDVTDELLTAEEAELEAVDDQRLVEVVIAPDSGLVGETLESLHFRQRYDASVLALRRGGEIIHARMDERKLRGGDTLLVQASEETVSRLAIDREFVVAGEFDLPQYREEKLPIALGIVAAVVAIAGLGIASIALSALAGVVAMVVTRCLHPGEVYDAVDWNVIVLLAGLLPLGLAMEQTGAAAFLAGHVVQSAGGLTPILLLGVFYLLTAGLTNVVSNNASVVLLIPVAVDVAVATGANPFAFAIAVTFAASTAFMTPMGYQTNLMVYGPGGYRFADFVRVGGPLQLLLAVVTVLGIWGIWGV